MRNTLIILAVLAVLLVVAYILVRSRRISREAERPLSAPPASPIPAGVIQGEAPSWLAGAAAPEAANWSSPSRPEAQAAGSPAWNEPSPRGGELGAWDTQSVPLPAAEQPRPELARSDETMILPSAPPPPAAASDWEAESRQSSAPEWAATEASAQAQSAPSAPPAWAQSDPGWGASTEAVGEPAAETATPEAATSEPDAAASGEPAWEPASSVETQPAELTAGHGAKGPVEVTAPELPLGEEAGHPSSPGLGETSEAEATPSWEAQGESDAGTSGQTGQVEELPLGDGAASSDWSAPSTEGESAPEVQPSEPAAAEVGWGVASPESPAPASAPWETSESSSGWGSGSPAAEPPPVAGWPAGEAAAQAAGTASAWEAPSDSAAAQPEELEPAPTWSDVETHTPPSSPPPGSETPPPAPTWADIESEGHFQPEPAANSEPVAAAWLPPTPAPSGSPSLGPGAPVTPPPGSAPPQPPNVGETMILGQAPTLAPAQAEVQIETGPDSGHIYRLTGPGLSIGRSPDNELILRDPATSGHHARVERRGAQFYIVDLGSTNGTLVNGQPVQESELKLGDRITIGQNQVKFSVL